MSNLFPESGGPGSAPPPPDPHNSGNAPDMSEVNALIDRRLNEAEDRHQKQMQEQRARYEAQIKAQNRAGIQDSYVPFHAGGPGEEMAETWCAAWQDMATAGDVPEIVLAHARGQAPPDTGDAA